MNQAIEYEQAFESFLACTTEKAVLQEVVSQKIKQSQAGSLLDIGPGTGELSVPLSKLVDRYVGIEPIEAYVDQLRQSGLEVIHGDFPVFLSERFDLVLASHVISLTDTEVKPFLSGARAVLNTNGQLIVITHHGNDKDWQAVCACLDQDNLPYHLAVFGRIEQLLSASGQLQIEQVKTTIQSARLEHMVAAIGFVWSDGNRERWHIFDRHQEKVKQLLEERYRQNGVFTFPFIHSIVIWKP